MAANLDIIKNNTTYTTKGGEDFFANNVRITEIYVKKDGKETLVWQYDVTAPTIVMSAPTSSDSDNPTVTYSSTYVVKGTYEDTESGIKSITVNGVNATFDNGTFTCSIGLSNRVTTGVTVVATDNAGNVTTVVTYVIYVVSETVGVSNYSGNTSDSKSASGSSPHGSTYRGYATATATASAWYMLPRYTRSVTVNISTDGNIGGTPMDSGTSVSKYANIYAEDGSTLLASSTGGTIDTSKWSNQELRVHAGGTSTKWAQCAAGYSCSAWASISVSVSATT